MRLGENRSVILELAHYDAMCGVRFALAEYVAPILEKSITDYLGNVNTRMPVYYPVQRENR